MVFKFTVDKLTDKYTPSNQVRKLPSWAGHFLGVNQNLQHPRPDYLIWLEILVGTFCGVLLLEGVFRNPNVFLDDHNAPIIIASYGASAILCFNANQAPLAQPRNVIEGHFVAALLGVCLEKLFLLTQTGADHYYIGGALSVGLSSVLMLILNCVHPPAGASALLPFISEPIRKMSWWYLPTHLVSSVLMVSVACITGNVFRKYPVFWWTPYVKPKDPEPEPEPEQASVLTSKESKNVVEITGDTLYVPEMMYLSQTELEFLKDIQLKLRDAEKPSV